VIRPGTARAPPISPSATTTWRRTPASLSLSAAIRPSTAASAGLCCAVTPRDVDHSSDGWSITAVAPMKMALVFMSVRTNTAREVMRFSC
jgi:hypothetical protein